MADTQVKNETVLAAIDGDERIYCVDDPAGTPADRYVTPELLGPTRHVPYFTNANTYLVPPCTATVGGAVAVNTLYMVPVWVPYRRTFTTLAAVVTALGAGTARMGLYNANAKTAQPTTLLADGGATVDVSTTGTKTLTISQALNPGLYFLAYVTDVSHSVVRMTNGNGLGLGATINGTAFTTNGGLTRTFTYAALPADETAQTYNTQGGAASGVPIIGIR